MFVEKGNEKGKTENWEKMRIAELENDGHVIDLLHLGSIRGIDNTIWDGGCHLSSSLKGCVR